MSWLRDWNDAPQVRHAVRQCGSVAAGGWGSAGGRSCGSEGGASIFSLGDGLGCSATGLVKGSTVGVGTWDFGVLRCEERRACRLVAETLRPVD